MAPVEDLVRARLYPAKPNSHKWRYDVDDRVRIVTGRRPFRKGYLSDWSEEIFDITSRLPTSQVTYELRDLAGERIKGRFYEPELSEGVEI